MLLAAIIAVAGTRIVYKGVQIASINNAIVGIAIAALIVAFTWFIHWLLTLKWPN